MEKEIYLEQLKQIQIETEEKKRNLAIKYALSNAKFKIGQTIKDERWTFVIDKITVYNSGIPEPVYHGFELKKDGTIKKNRDRGSIYGNNCELVT